MFSKAEHEKSSLGEQDEGLHMRIKLSEGANNGSDFDVFAVISNDTDTERECRLRLCARTASYNGEVGPQCGSKDLLNLTLQPRLGKAIGGYRAWGPCCSTSSQELSQRQVPACAGSFPKRKFFLQPPTAHTVHTMA